MNPDTIKVDLGTYGNYSTENYGSSRYVSIGPLTLYFSYRTVVAFRCPKFGLVVCENVWSRTTGKHLNWLEPEKKRRHVYKDFMGMLEETLQHYGLAVN